MQKLQFLLVIFVSYTGVNECLAATEESQLIRYINRKCNPDIAEQVKKEAELLSAELDRAFGYIPDNLEHFCKNERNFLSQVANGAAHTFSRCVSGEESYLPGFFNHTFNGFLHFLCHSYGENIKSLYSEEGQACMKQLRTAEAAQHLDACFVSILGPASQNVVKKAELCHDMGTAKMCFARVIDNRCPSGQVLPKLNERLFVDLTRPCRPPKPVSDHQKKNGSGRTETTISQLLAFCVLLFIGKYAL